MAQSGDGKECHEVVKIRVAKQANDLHCVVGAYSLRNDTRVVDRGSLDKNIQLLRCPVDILGSFVWVSNDWSIIAALLCS